jgi:gliding motility-associated-like protein
VDLVIFNRWGLEEYRNTNYRNNWDGRNKNGFMLPNDTYFYILRFNNGLARKGTVLIKR